MTVQAVDEAKVEQLMGTLVGYMTGGAMCLGIWLGDELGFYTALAGAGPTSAETLASKTGCNARLVREWLDSQTAGGLITYDAAADAYTLTPEASLPLADETAPVFVARAMNAIGSFYRDIDKFKDAFRTDGALSWADHDHTLFQGTEWFFRPGYRAALPGEWIPALDGVVEKLQAGGKVADIGCGHGASTIAMADAFPNSKFWGFDFHDASIETSKERAAEAGVSDRTTFATADAKSYDGTYDLICFFDCLHDMGDPVGIARYAREHLAPGGTVLLVEPFALDDRVANLSQNPMAPLLYLASTVICTPNSLSQDVGLGLGAQAGEARLREVFEQAGFSTLRKAAETPLNLILEAKA
ncbi:MAG: class I SAM-dependent methyltransferase [Actinomycetota bacterium]